MTTNGHQTGHKTTLPDVNAPDEYTDLVIAAMSPETAPRTKQVLSSLIRHLHHFARDIDLTTEEWLAACEFVNRIGQISSSKRDEAILVSDVLGLESLVDELAHKKAESLGEEENTDNEATYSAILGPFWRQGAPEFPIDGDIVVKHFENEDTAYFSGHIKDMSGNPLAGVEVDVWHTGPNGLYDAQDDSGPNFNMRGRIMTDKDGFYGFYCLKPVPYPIPYDGPAGDLLQLQGRHPMRPAHIHLMVSKTGYKKLITQVFDSKGKYLADDSVFAVKDSLLIDFRPASEKRKAKAQWEVEYNIQLAAQPK